MPGKLTPRTGIKPTYTQKVAQVMNWYRRCIMGLIGQINFQSGYFIMADPEYARMSQSRKNQLVKITKLRQAAQERLNELILAIEEFNSLPITQDDELKGRHSRHHRTFKRTKERSLSSE
jgi:hypothetical protein